MIYLADPDVTLHQGVTKYRTIVADPPWPIEWKNGSTRKNGRGERHPVHTHSLAYPTMTIDEIAALDVASLADDDAHLFLWTVDRFLIDGTAGRVAEAWGFVPKRLLIWRKPGFGLGSFPRPQHEAVVVATRGSLPFRVRDAGSVQDWNLVFEKVGRSVARRHSAKPDGFLDLIERASPGPYLELFARSQRFGWDTWGNEAFNHVEIGA